MSDDHSAGQIDNAVAAAGVRAIWNALSDYDPKLRSLLQEALNAEVSGLLMQQELDGDDADPKIPAIVQMLSMLAKP